MSDKINILIKEMKSPDNTLLHKVSIVLTMISDEVKEIIKNIKQTKQNFRNIHEIKYRLGLRHYHNREFTDAIRCFRHAVKHPQNKFSLAYYYLGNIELIGYLTYFQKLKCGILNLFNVRCGLIIEYDTVIEYYQKAVESSHNNCLQASYMIDKIKQKPVEYIPGEILQEKYDYLADDYENSYVKETEYTGHLETIKTLRNITESLNRRIDILDLGCGTGLVGQALRKLGIVRKLVGIDISQQSLQLCQNLEFNNIPVYDTLINDDVRNCLEQHKMRYDLITATDLFSHLGDLDTIVKNCSDLLSPNGVLCFSIIKNFDNSDYEFLYSSDHFCHSLHYIRNILCNNNLEELSVSSYKIQTDVFAYQITAIKDK